MKVCVEGRNVQSADVLGDAAWWNSVSADPDCPRVLGARVVSCRRCQAGYDVDVELELAGTPRRGLGFPFVGVAVLLVAAGTAAGGFFGLKEGLSKMGTGIRALVLLGAGAWLGKAVLDSIPLGLGIGAAVYYGVREQA